MKKITQLLLCAVFFGFSFQGISQNVQQSIQQQLNQLLENNEITAQDMNWAITSEHVSSVSDIHHVYYRQLLNGVEIIGSESSIHIYPNGEILASDNAFIANTSDQALTGATPAINAMQAVQMAASHFNYSISGALSVVSSKGTAANETVLSNAGISKSDIPARLVYQMNQNNELVLAWDLSIEEVAQENWWSVRVDATTGAIVDQVNWMVSCAYEHDHSEHSEYDYNQNLFDIPNYGKNTAPTATAVGPTIESYEVFALPLESPYYGARTIEVDPADATASPFGWHDLDGVAGPETMVTEGNNVDAFEFGDNSGYQPDGGVTLEFVGYPFDQNYTNANQYEDASLTNLFYWSNICHDVKYVYGFDEASGNFQVNNYGNGGAGNDSVRAEGQDGAGSCNATMGTPNDGSSPTMSMFICNNKDGSFDNLVIIHEYTHGTTNRLTGGGNNTSCLNNSEQMGEGWSDYYGVVMTMEPGAMGADPRGVGTYLFNQGPAGAGIRPFPYSTDLAVNPQTYDDIKTAAVPHGVGSVWCTTLWEVTWTLIDAHGYDADIYNFTGDVTQDAGNVQALALITEALKIQPCSPGFVDGRDAIIAADQAIYGGANLCDLWDAFAKRGLGASADQGSSGSTGDGTEAFDTPSGAATLDTFEDVCVNDPVITNAGGGSPVGGVYSGTGVTDNGDGLTYTFDPAVAGVGTTTITYDIPANACAPAGSDTDTVEVLDVPASPTAVGESDFCVGDMVTVTATPNDPTNEIRWYDAATDGNLLFVGTDYTYTPTGSESLYAEEVPPGPASQLKISEVSLQTPDQLEIQNVGIATDYTGYAVASSETPYTDINTVNPDVQILGAMGADSAQYWDDDSGSAQYWGSNLFWNDGSSGWIIIIDDAGNVVDSVFWNLSAGEIGTFSVTINGFAVTAADLDWMGDGAAMTVGCADSYRRDNDSDDATNWADVCLASDYGVPNADINLGYQGCLGDRAEAVVAAETEVPTVTCPADVIEVVSPGDQFTIPDYTGGASATDNCPGAVALSQDPVVGTMVGAGVTVVTITATDSAGNEATCTFNVTVTEVLGLSDNALSNLISLAPNPTNGQLTLVNTSTELLTSATISDVNGRTIKTIDLQNTGTQTQFSVEELATGMYFVRIDSETSSAVKQIVRQ